MLKKTLAVATVALSIGVAACGNIGPQPKKTEPNPQAASKLYEVDLTKPEGPMMQVLRSAQDRDENLFKASFAPEVNVAAFDEATFRKLRKKVLAGKVTPVPEAVQQVSDTEAIVKMRTGNGREIPITVKKYGDKWLISDIKFGNKALQKYRESNNGTPAQAQPAKPQPPTGK